MRWEGTGKVETDPMKLRYFPKLTKQEREDAGPSNPMAGALSKSAMYETKIHSRLRVILELFGGRD